MRTKPSKTSPAVFDAAEEGTSGCRVQRSDYALLSWKTLEDRVWVAVKLLSDSVRLMSLYNIESSEKKPEEKTGYEVFASKMTTGIACASGGAVIGSFFGPIGSVVGAGAFAVTGFIFAKPSDAGKNK